MMESLNYEEVIANPVVDTASNRVSTWIGVLSKHHLHSACSLQDIAQGNRRCLFSCGCLSRIRVMHPESVRGSARETLRDLVST